MAQIQDNEKIMTKSTHDKDEPAQLDRYAQTVEELKFVWPKVSDVHINSLYIKKNETMEANNSNILASRTRCTTGFK